MNIEQLSEVCGLHAGDGYLRNDGRRRELDISGNVEEKEFYDNHVAPLFSECFNTEINCRYFKSRNTYGFVIRDRKIIEEMHYLGFPYGKKSGIVRMPEFVLESNENIKRFMRGLFDTDGCITFDKKYKQLHYYPRIIISLCSKGLHDDISLCLCRLGIKYWEQEYTPKKETENPKYITWVRGKEEVDKWFSLIGSKNQAKVSKYILWKKQGYCPTNITNEQVKQMINGPVA